MISKKQENIFTPEEILKKYWVYSAFRPLQKEIIEQVIQAKDTLAILPTGGGKSVCFQVSGLMLSGVCLVISPLIALMKDQVFQLKKRGIPAEAVFSGLEREKITQILNDTIDEKIKFLYISPERLKTKAFLQALPYLKIGLLAIDEAHCISKWGYDFRPSYLDIKNIKDYYTGEPFPTIALTATATNVVRKDIAEKLNLSRPGVFVKSFARENLSYIVVETDSKEKYLYAFLEKYPGSAIVYTRTRKRTTEMAAFLRKNGINADYYHAGLSMSERNKKQDNWISGSTRVIVATNAFGMGIDKPDVRLVAHMDLCENLEAYYQESGRAGRDGKSATTLLLYNENDVVILEKNLDRKYPEISVIKKTYQALANFYQVMEGDVNLGPHDFDLHTFISTFGLNALETHYALKILESQNLIYLSDSYSKPSLIKIICSPSELEDFQDKYPGYGEFIRTILRIYGGEIYTSFTAIQENEIALALNTTYSSVIRTLNSLKLIFHYSQQKYTPQISFVSYRFDTEKMPLKEIEIKRRKENDYKAMQAMIRYAEHTQLCRMAMIQEYFDEKDPQDCGKCDVCLAKGKLHQTDLKTDLKNKIWALLPASIPKLEENLSLHDKEEIGNIIKNGLRSGGLKMDSFGLIYPA